MKKLFWLSLAVLVIGSAAGCSVDNTYAVCDTTSDCEDTFDECLGVVVAPAGTSGQFCSRNCFSDSDCESNFGFSGACYNIEGTEQVCYQRCQFDADCYSSSVCIEVTLPGGVTDFVCVPNN